MLWRSACGGWHRKDEKRDKEGRTGMEGRGLRKGGRGKTLEKEGRKTRKEDKEGG